MRFKKRTESPGDKSLLPENRCHNVFNPFQGWIAQLVEQRTENPRVPGSIPGPATSLLNQAFMGFLVPKLVKVGKCLAISTNFQGCLLECLSQFV